MFKWIIEHKADMGWAAGAVLATAKSFIYVRKRWYIPSTLFFKKITYELNNNGGKSIKDLVEKTNTIVNKLAADGEAMRAISDECIFKCDENGMLTCANESMCDLYGAALEDMKGYGAVNFIKPSQQDEVLKRWERAIKHDSSILMEYTIIHGVTGVHQPCQLRAAIKRNPAGQIISILGTISKKK